MRFFFIYKEICGVEFFFLDYGSCCGGIFIWVVFEFIVKIDKVIVIYRVLVID